MATGRQAVQMSLQHAAHTDQPGESAWRARPGQVAEQVASGPRQLGAEQHRLCGEGHFDRVARLKRQNNIQRVGGPRRGMAGRLVVVTRQGADDPIHSGHADIR